MLIPREEPLQRKVRVHNFHKNKKNDSVEKFCIDHGRLLSIVGFPKNGGNFCIECRNRKKKEKREQLKKEKEFLP